MEPSNDSNLTPPGFRNTDPYRLRSSNQNYFVSFFYLKAACDGNI